MEAIHGQVHHFSQIFVIGSHGTRAKYFQTSNFFHTILDLFFVKAIWNNLFEWINSNWLLSRCIILTKVVEVF